MGVDEVGDALLDTTFSIGKRWTFRSPRRQTCDSGQWLEDKEHQSPQADNHVGQELENKQTKDRG